LKLINLLISVFIYLKEASFNGKKFYASYNIWMNDLTRAGASVVLNSKNISFSFKDFLVILNKLRSYQETSPT
jgi:hypothetical protein